jgi:hypothetical protein
LHGFSRGWKTTFQIGKSGFSYPRWVRTALRQIKAWKIREVTKRLSSQALPPMPSDPSYAPKRKARRVKFSRGVPVQIVGLDGTWRRDCLMMDVAFGGAKLVIEPSTNRLASKEFFLVLSTTGAAYRRCELVWSSGEQLGVRFVESVNNSPKTKSPGKA